MSVETVQIRVSPAPGATRSTAEQLFKATLDLLPIGILFVDASSTIFHSNATAAAMLSAGRPIRSCRGQLGADSPVTALALRAAARTMAQNTSRVCALTVPLRSNHGEAAIAYVRPLDLDITLRGEKSRSVVVFITEAAEHSAPPIAGLTALFKLTSAETGVLEQIVSGKNRKETGNTLGIADSTVKTHLESIYAKTGTCNQLSLCRLVEMLSCPTRADPTASTLR